MATVHTYGGSITYGIGDEIGGGWATRLRSTMARRALHNREPDVPRAARVHNLGRSALKLPSIIRSLPHDILHRDGRGRLIIASMVGFSESGIPDGASEAAVPLAQFKSSLRAMGDLCTRLETYIQSTIPDFSIVNIFVELPPMDLSRPHPDNAGDIDLERIATYQTAVRSHCINTGAQFIETYHTLTASPVDPISVDGIHPSSEGHRLIHDIVLGEVDELLAKSDG